MYFNLSKILVCILVPLMLGVSDYPREFKFHIDLTGSTTAVLTVEGRQEELTQVLSADGLIFKLHCSSGVFIDRGAFSVLPGQAVRMIDQLSGPGGTDLVVYFAAPMMAEGRVAPQPTAADRALDTSVLRFVFFTRNLVAAARVASDNSSELASQADEESADPIQNGKIDEMRALVRELTVELLDVRRKLAEDEKELKDCRRD